MSKTKEKTSTTRPEKHRSLEKRSAEKETAGKETAGKEAKVEYESGLLPLLWLAIPFALLLLYGILT